MYRSDEEKEFYEIPIQDDVEQSSPNYELREDVKVDDEKTQPNDDKTVEDNGQQPGDGNYFGQLQRLKAEFSNYKKRVDNDRLKLSDIVKGELITKLLPVLDDFDRLLEHSNNNHEEVVQGIKLIHKKLVDTLQEQGLKPVKSVGEKFNPKFHEALIVDHHEGAEDDLVLDEWRKGYLFKDRLLRPAQVKVNKLKDQDR